MVLLESDSISGAPTNITSNEINSLASMATMEIDTTDFKLITNVNIKFKTNKVTQALPQIEKILLSNKGVILESSIESYNVSDILVSKTIDSIYYQEEKNIRGQILVYVPKKEVYKVLEEITPFATQIESREISSQDVTIDLLKAALSIKRGKRKQDRIENITANQPAKLEDKLNAEESLDYALQTQDENKIEQFDIYRKLKYTLVSIDIGQDSFYRDYSMPQQEEYSIKFKDQLLMGLLYGWNMLSSILLFFVYIWPITILIALGIIFYFKKIRNKKTK